MAGEFWWKIEQGRGMGMDVAAQASLFAEECEKWGIDPEDALVHGMAKMSRLATEMAAGTNPPRMPRRTVALVADLSQAVLVAIAMLALMAAVSPPIVAH